VANLTLTSKELTMALANFGTTLNNANNNRLIFVVIAAEQDEIDNCIFDNTSIMSNIDSPSGLRQVLGAVNSLFDESYCEFVEIDKPQ
jgi:hypothetical protein